MDRDNEDDVRYAQANTASRLSKRVASMPSLHMLANKLPQQHAAVVTESSSPASVLIPPSPDFSSSASEGTMSRYASAINLRELGETDDNDNKEGNGRDDDGGDKMIDLKAEDFIARFYEEMRIQNHNEMVRRQSKLHRHRRHSIPDGSA
ncbi:hypothetical protein MLD38_005083 [Melastoma candidum]|uniref:Uncharacterized protein n=1 Tax=Melastoma candidum TaxID=119954 RepID=A0ACB9S7H0_9MYRT|nr:hypothetical protein MLD38_005083 [Melastoma candidum]